MRGVGVNRDTGVDGSHWGWPRAGLGRAWSPRACGGVRLTSKPRSRGIHLSVHPHGGIPPKEPPGTGETIAVRIIHARMHLYVHATGNVRHAPFGKCT